MTQEQLREVLRILAKYDMSYLKCNLDNTAFVLETIESKFVELNEKLNEIPADLEWVYSLLDISTCKSVQMDNIPRPPNVKYTFWFNDKLCVVTKRGPHAFEYEHVDKTQDVTNTGSKYISYEYWNDNVQLTGKGALLKKDNRKQGVLPS